MDSSFEREQTVAVEAATKATAVILGHYTSFEKLENAPIDISTIADRESQEAILRHIHAVFPTDALCAEEVTASLEGVPRLGARLWIVDPIDGSRGFARKNGEFSVMIAFVRDGVLGVGVVLEPALGRLTFARRDGGCWAVDGGGTPRRCQVSAVTEPDRCALIQSHSKTGQSARAKDALKPARVIETYSAGVKLARVARGEADVYVNTYAEFHDWDIAAGHLLVSEAGGEVTGLGGEALSYGAEGAWQRYGLIAANSVLRQKCVDLMRPKRGEPAT